MDVGKDRDRVGAKRSVKTVCVRMWKGPCCDAVIAGYYDDDATLDVHGGSVQCVRMELCVER